MEYPVLAAMIGWPHSALRLQGDRDMGDPKGKQLALGLTLAHRAGRDPFQRPQGHCAEQGTQAGT